MAIYFSIPPIAMTPSCLFTCGRFENRVLGVSMGAGGAFIHGTLYGLLLLCTSHWTKKSKHVIIGKKKKMVRK